MKPFIKSWSRVWLVLVFGPIGWMPCCLDAAEPPANWEIAITSNLPSGVAWRGEAANYIITVKNKTGVPQTAELQVRLRVPGEAPVPFIQESVALNPDGAGDYKAELPTAETGYWSVQASLEQAGKEVARTESALLVVRDSKLPDPDAAGSFFGTMFIRDAQAAARIGVRVERRQAAWAWLQPRNGQEYSWDAMDRGIEDRKQAGIATILTIRPELRPKWAVWKSVEELAGPDYIADFKAFVRAVVDRYKDRVLAVEIMNEPDLECAREAAGAIATTEVYARLLQAGYAAAKEIAPALPVIGLDVSGVDFPQLRFSEAVLARKPGLDIIGGHPYNHSRYLGGDARPESPSAMDAAGRFRAMAALMKRHGQAPRIWSTEFGWALHLDESLGSPAARLFAAYTAQALLLARSVPEVEKLFWFAATFPGKERASSYGLFRKADERVNYQRSDGVWYPAPSAAAYATCARFLENVICVGDFKIGVLGRALRFRNPAGGDDVLALWLDDNEAAGGGARLQLPGKAEFAWSAVDGLGRTVKPAGALTLEPLPLFITVKPENADRLEQILRTAPLEAKERIRIQSVYSANGGSVSVVIINQGTEGLPAKIFVEGQENLARSRMLEPGITHGELPVPLITGRPETVKIVIMEELTGRRRVADFDYHFRGLPKLGSAGEIRNDSTPLILQQRDQVLPADPGVDWRGPDDLSATVWTGWTEEGIVLRVDVNDNLQNGPRGSATDVWNYDSLQVAFDFGNRADFGYNEDCREISLALGDSGPVILEDNKIRTLDGTLIRREGTLTSYQVFFPWSWLGNRKLGNNDIFRMNLIVNDNDGQGRKCWIGLAPGIGEVKRPSAFPQWRLQENSR